MSLQEPVSVSLSALNLAIQFHGWISFFILVYYKLPLTDNRKTYYQYTGLWHLYGVLAMNCWFWAAVFHSRFVYALFILLFENQTFASVLMVIIYVLELFNLLGCK